MYSPSEQVELERHTQRPTESKGRTLVDLTTKLQVLLTSSLIFDQVTRVGPTTLHVNVWNYDPEVQDGFTLDCKLGVST